MVEKALIAIITAVFLMSSWWWSNRQNDTVNFYEEQLRERDTVITQLCSMALPQVQGKTSVQVQELLRDLYPQYDMRDENGVFFAGSLGVCFSDEKAATGFFFPWDAADSVPSQ